MTKKFKCTALGSIPISDTLIGLMAAYYLPTDIEQVAQISPAFHFNPVRDTEFFKYHYGIRSHDEYLRDATKVLTKFHNWLPQANPMERTLMTVCALTGSYEILNDLVWDVYRDMRVNFTLEYIDADDTLYHVTDYEKMRLDDNLNAALFTPTTLWWSRQFEQQAQRLLKTPDQPFETFRFWFDRLQSEQDILTKKLRRHGDQEDYRVVDRTNRRIFNRSLKMFIQFFGETNTKKFLHGKNLWLRGHHFVWRLKIINCDLLNQTVDPSGTQTPFHIGICDHELNKLAEACVVFPNTPILEQAIAISLWLADLEDEIELLRTANVYRFTKLGLTNNLLQSFAKSDLIERVFRPTEYDYEPDAEDELPVDLSIDDGPSDTPEPLPDYDDLFRYNALEHEWNGMPIDPDDPENRAFCHDPTSLAYSSLSDLSDLSENERIIALYRQVHEQSNYEKRLEIIHPIVRRLRTKLFSQLDIPDELLYYMRYPEFRFYNLRRVTQAPRLSRFLETKSLKDLSYESLA
jgi:hypothetical protein